MRDTLRKRMQNEGPTAVSRALALGALLMLAACGSSDEPCGVPGVAVACACGAVPGARVCTTEKTLSACDCSGAIPLPNAVISPQGGEGGGGAGGSSGAGGRAGAGGRSGEGGMGGSGGMTGGSGGVGGEPDDDGGVEPDAGGIGGDGGSGGSPPLEMPYNACMNNSDCKPEGTCQVTTNLPNNATVCMPHCTVVGDCPVPEGDYDAVVTCTEGLCRLDCTPVVFQPLLSCPTEMTCISDFFGASACHAN